MQNIVRLAEPHANPLKVSADGGLDVVSHVTHAEMEWGWSKLREILENEPSTRMREWSEDGRTEDEFRLLCGLFVAVSHEIPMVTSNFIEWLRLLDDTALDGYVVWRMKQLGDQDLEYVLAGRDLESLGLQKIDEPTSRRPISLFAVKRAIGMMSLDEVVELHAAFASRIDDLRSDCA